tara:strand:+ start:224 stop:385 length:162 start_codon:yes stop_codon:yes gene_type:complete
MERKLHNVRIDKILPELKTLSKLEILGNEFNLKIVKIFLNVIVVPGLYIYCFV